MQRQQLEPELNKSGTVALRTEPESLPEWLLPPKEESENEAVLMLEAAHAEESNSRERLLLLFSQYTQFALWLTCGITLLAGQLPLSLGAGGLAWLLCLLERRAKALEQTRIVLRLHDYPTEKMGALVEALETTRGSLRETARAVLAHHLPPLLSNREESLTETQRRTLYRRLRMGEAKKQSAFTHTLLTAIEQSGDPQALPYVEALADARAVTPTQRRLRKAAQECLRTLEPLVEMQEAPVLLITEGEGVVPATSIAETAEATQALSPAQLRVEKQLTELQQEAERSRQPGMRLGYLIASWVVIVPYTAFQMIYSLFQRHDWMQTVAWGIFCGLATQFHHFTLSLRQSEAVRRLAEDNNVQGVGALADALEWPDEEIKQIAAQALIRLLPKLRASDATLLAPRQRACLYRRLTMANARQQHDLLLAILRSLEQVGDGNAYPFVKRLAEAEATSNRERKVQEAAQQCLPFLEALAQQENYSQTLLRASSIHDTPAEVLVRPVVSAPSEPPEQLLRASNVED